MSETQVYRLSPEAGKYYKTAEYTRAVGTYPNETYFTTNTLKYVGKFVRGITEGSGDGRTHYDIFDKNGKAEIVHYSYWGTTSFVETVYEDVE